MTKRRFSVRSDFEPYFIAGFLGAFARDPENGFRLRDAVFFINLASNWMEPYIGERVLGVAGTQVQRSLDALVMEGFARRGSRAKTPVYFLNRSGVLECLRRLHGFRSNGRFDLFLFIYFLLRSYQARLVELVRGSNDRFPESFRVEIESLCDVTILCLEQKHHLEAQLKKLASRIASAQGIARLLQQSKLTAETAELIQRRFPYALNSEEPMERLIASFTARDIEWELKTGGANRIRFLWKPTERILELQLEIVRELLQEGSA